MGYFTPLVNIATTWTRPDGHRLLLQAGVMWVDTNAHYAPAPEVKPGYIPLTELSTGLTYNSRVDTALNYFHDPQANGFASATYVTGSHSFKGGFTFKRGYLDQFADATNEPPVTYALQKPRLGGANPMRITEYALPTAHETGLGLYAQDGTLKTHARPGRPVRYFHAVPARTRRRHTPAFTFAASTTCRTGRMSVRG
jgi:hypothetical protein